MKLKDVTCKMLMRINVVDGQENYVLEDADFVKKNWVNMTDEARKGWYEALEHTFTPNAEDVLDSIIDTIDSCDCYYDGMEDVISSVVITEENQNKLQDVLDEIFCKDVCRSYSKGRSIEG